MLKGFIRVASFVVIFASTSSAAQSLDDLIDSLDLDVLNAAQMEKEDVDVDTGFEADQKKYSFGAKRKLAKDLTFNMGVGAMYKYRAERSLSNSYRGGDTQTNNIEENFDPTNASPMIGASVGYKF